MAATRLSFSYPEELKEKLQKLATKDSRTLSSYVQKVLAEHIDDNWVDPEPEYKPEPEKKKPVKKTRRKIKL